MKTQLIISSAIAGLLSLSAASGARLAQKAPDILEFLATDERPFVRGAVRAAQRRIRTLVA